MFRCNCALLKDFMYLCMTICRRSISGVNQRVLHLSIMSVTVAQLCLSATNKRLLVNASQHSNTASISTIFNLWKLDFT